MTYFYLATLLFISMNFGCSDSSGGMPKEPDPVLVFGADQHIENRPTTAIDEIDARNETRELAILYAPQLIEEEKFNHLNGSFAYADCKFNISVVSLVPEELEIEVTGSLGDCPSLESSVAMNEVDLSVNIKSVLFCLGADFSGFSQRSVIDSLSLIRLREHSCDFYSTRVGHKVRSSSRLRIVSQDQDGAKKTLLSEVEMEESYQGDFCYRDSKNESFEIDACKTYIWTKSFNGDSHYEKESYTAGSARSGAKMVRAEVSREKMLFEKNSLFYSSGTALVRVNNWQGQINYNSSFQSPNIVLENKGESIEFRLPNQRPNLGLNFVTF